MESLTRKRLEQVCLESGLIMILNWKVVSEVDSILAA